jgi:CRP/FNR family cyclic AMP-dependent transcriptional regulator
MTSAPAPTAASWRDLLRSGRWFHGIPEAMQTALLTHGVVRQLRDGERLFSRGDPPSGIYAVLEGAMRVSATTESGKEALLTLVEAPIWFGEIAVFDGEARTHDATAEGATKLLHVGREELARILDAHPQWWRDLGLLVTQKLRLTFLMMEATATLPLATRLAQRLAWMAAGYGDWHGRTARDLAVSQEELASMMAASRQSVNQALKDFEARGFIKVTYGHIEVLDIEALRTAE